MPVLDHVVVIAVQTKVDVVLAAVKTAACIWWAIHRDMAPKAASSLLSHAFTSAWVMVGGPALTVGRGIVPFTILQRFGAKDPSVQPRCCNWTHQRWGP